MKRKRNVHITLFVLLVGILAVIVTACKQEVKNADLGEIYQKIEGLGKMPQMVSLDGEMLENYYGIQSDECNQVVAKVCTDAMLADEIVLIEAKEGTSAEQIEQKLKTRLENKAEEAQGYSPEQFAIIKKCMVKREGNYICMIVSPDAEIFGDVYGSSFE